MHKQTVYGLILTIIIAVVAVAFIKSSGDPHTDKDTVTDAQSNQDIQNGSPKQKVDSQRTSNDDHSSKGMPSDSVAEIEEAPPIHIPQSVYPDLPVELYLANLPAAQDGDVQSQYDVYRALRECDDIYRSEKQIDELAWRSSKSQAVVELRYRLKRCTELHQLLDDDQLAARREHWYQTALANGHPIVRSEYYLLHTDNLSEARKSLATALTSADHESIALAAIYVAKVQGNVDPLASLPWEYLACEVNPGCSVESIKGALANHFQQHDFDDLMQKVDRIKENLDRKDFESLLPTEHDY